MSMLKATLAIAAIAVVAILASGPAAAQSRQQLEDSGDAFFYKGTGGVPPG